MDSNKIAANFQETTPDQVFSCLDESTFYAVCIEHLLLPQVPYGASLVEFGSGDGSPVIDALKNSDGFSGTITGYELNQRAHTICQENIVSGKVEHQYQVFANSFFKRESRDHFALLANPPYIPFPDNSIRLPYLHGGIQGCELTMRLLDESFPMALLILSSYSNPGRIISFARQKGLRVANFFVMPIEFGIYSSEPKVLAHIMDLRKQGIAFTSEKGYLLAGVLFVREEQCHNERCAELKRVMYSADPTG